MSKKFELTATCSPFHIDPTLYVMWLEIYHKAAPQYVVEDAVLMQNHLFDPDVTITIRAHTVQPRNKQDHV